MTVEPRFVAAQLLFQVRTGLQLTQAQAAARCDVATSTWASWESGAAQPSVERLAGVATALGVPLSIAAQLRSHTVQVGVTVG